MLQQSQYFLIYPLNQLNKDRIAKEKQKTKRHFPLFKKFNDIFNRRFILLVRCDICNASFSFFIKCNAV